MIKGIRGVVRYRCFHRCDTSTSDDVQTCLNTYQHTSDSSKLGVKPTQGRTLNAYTHAALGKLLATALMNYAISQTLAIRFRRSHMLAFR